MDLVTTVLPWVKGKVYSPEELREAARDFYGPDAIVMTGTVPDAQILGYIEAGYRVWPVVEMLDLAPRAAW